MKKSKILIVEDEILIANTISRYLNSKDYEVTGIAISYEEALELLKNDQPDLALLDIRLNGNKTGIDVAHYIRENLSIPHIYLTSQYDAAALQAAMPTFPSGYLNKPMQKETLHSTIEIALFNFSQNKKTEEGQILTLSSGSEKHKVSANNIIYMQSDHIYIKVFLKSPKQILLVRKTMKAMKEELPSKTFIQPNRSCIVNTKYIESWDSKMLKVEGTEISISRNNKDAIITKLEQNS